MEAKQNKKGGLRFALTVPTPSTFQSKCKELLERYEPKKTKSVLKERQRWQAIDIELSHWIWDEVVDRLPAVVAARGWDANVRVELDPAWFINTTIKLTFKDRRAAMLFKMAYC